MKKCIIALLVLCACFYGAAAAVAAESVIFDLKDPVGGATSKEGLTSTQRIELLNLIGTLVDDGSLVQGGTFTYSAATVNIPYQGMLLLWNPQTSKWVRPDLPRAASTEEVSASAARTYELKDSSVYNYSGTIGKIKMTYADAVSDGKDSSSGGCSAFAVGSLALLLVPMAFWGSKKKAA